MGDLRKGLTSHNVANDGNFSIQVLQRALLQFDKLDVTPLSAQEVKSKVKDYALEEAYICHSVDHWLAIRKINGIWYNLNSTNIVPPGPQIIGTFFLSAFFDSVLNSGYSIFIVRPTEGSQNKGLPSPDPMQFKAMLREN
mmetsp:Transcript_19597/g.30184  ORF Transcript_19597/g.30184 Transcript_19597/m.30184 type:complete len:140 (-) Transcript_19597:647-1066(-)